MTTLTAAATGTYSIDPTHSRLGFTARHAMVTKVRGSFNEFDGSGYFEDVTQQVGSGPGDDGDPTTFGFIRLEDAP